jgi:shikimate kinase
MQNLVLIGMKHCGKSTVGRALAEAIGARFVDTDDHVEALFAAQTGRDLSFREIFREVGDEGFAELERTVVRSLAREARDAGHSRRGMPRGSKHKPIVPGRLMVVALGGRTALRQELRGPIRSIGTVVYLQVDPEELFRRVEQGGIPPFLDPADPRGTFLKLHKERHPKYQRLADITVTLDGLSPARCVQAVQKALTAHDSQAKRIDRSSRRLR